jgi:hypothetical protein
MIPRVFERTGRSDGEPIHELDARRADASRRRVDIWVLEIAVTMVVWLSCRRDLPGLVRAHQFCRQRVVVGRRIPVCYVALAALQASFLTSAVMHAKQPYVM